MGARDELSNTCSEYKESRAAQAKEAAARKEVAAGAVDTPLPHLLVPGSLVALDTKALLPGAGLPGVSGPGGWVLLTMHLATLLAACWG
jgi:hypothetical protein